ncbi:hypothetical protein Tco_0744175 [Tanacetum coccineum]
MEANRLLALRLQEEEREQFTVEERAKFLHDTIQLIEVSWQNKELLQDERKIKEMNEGAKDLEQKRLKKKVAKETPKKEDTTKVPAKSWLVQDQTVLALASPKANELTIPEQTATGKGISNPFMAGSLPKTTKPT